MATITRAPTSTHSSSGTWDSTLYTTVDDYPDTTDFLTHGTTAGFIQFGFTAFDVPTGATINSIKVRQYLRKTGPAGNSAGERLVVNGTAYTGSARNLSKTATGYESTWTTNPNTSSAWTVDDVNGSGANPLQYFGMVATDANPTIELASIEIEVDYTAAASAITGSLD